MSMSMIDRIAGVFCFFLLRDTTGWLHICSIYESVMS